MPELNFEFFAIAAPAVVFAGISKGGFGSGAAFAAASILALVLEPGLALGIMLPLLMLIDLATLKPYWNKWDWRASGLLILGGIPGVALGAWLYQIASADFFRFLIGAISLAFVAWQVSISRGWITQIQRKLPDWTGVLAGVAAGFTSFVSHAGGPPAAVYLLAQRPSKTSYQGTTVLVFWAINLAKAVPYTVLGLFTLETLRIDLMLAPFALLGAWIGVKLHHMVPERAFFLLTYVLLVLTGTRLIWMSMT